MTALFSLGCGAAGEIGPRSSSDATPRSEASLLSFPVAADSDGQLPITAVSVGTDHCLALAAGRPYRWGLLGASAGRFSKYGQQHSSVPGLAAAAPEVVPNPQPLPTWAFGCSSNSSSLKSDPVLDELEEAVGAIDGQVAAVACGGSNTFLLTSGGDVFLYGDLRPPGGPPDRLFRLWAASPPGRGTPTPSVLNLRPKVKRLAAGWRHCILLTDTGITYALGDDEYGQCAGVGTGEAKVPIPTQHAIIGVAAGTCHSLAWDQLGSAFAWGHGGAGRLGIGSTQHCSYPSRLSKLQEPVSDISCGANFTVFATNNGQSLWACGGNQHGQLGLALPLHAQQHTPEKLDLPRPAEVVCQLQCGTNHTLCMTRAVSASDAEARPVLWAWGCSSSGQCGKAPGELPGEPPAARTTPEPLVEFMAPSPHWPLLVAAGRTRSLIVTTEQRQHDFDDHITKSTPKVDPDMSGSYAFGATATPQHVEGSFEKHFQRMSTPELGSPYDGSTTAMGPDLSVTEASIDAAWSRLRGVARTPPSATLASSVASPGLEVGAFGHVLEGHCSSSQPRGAQEAPFKERIVLPTPTASPVVLLPPDPQAHLMNEESRSRSSSKEVSAATFPKPVAADVDPMPVFGRQHQSKVRADDIIDDFCAQLLQLERDSSSADRDHHAKLAAMEVSQQSGQTNGGHMGYAPSPQTKPQEREQVRDDIIRGHAAPRSPSPVAALVEMGEEALRTPVSKASSSQRRRPSSVEELSRSPAFSRSGWSAPHLGGVGSCGVGGDTQPPAHPRPEMSAFPLGGWCSGRTSAPRARAARHSIAHPVGLASFKDRGKKWWTQQHNSSPVKTTTSTGMAAWISEYESSRPPEYTSTMHNYGLDGRSRFLDDVAGAWSDSSQTWQQLFPPPSANQHSMSPAAKQWRASALRDVAMAQVESQVHQPDQWSGVWGSLTDLNAMLTSMGSKAGVMVAPPFFSQSLPGQRLALPIRAADVRPAAAEVGGVTFEATGSERRSSTPEQAARRKHRARSADREQGKAAKDSPHRRSPQRLLASQASASAPSLQENCGSAGLKIGRQMPRARHAAESKRSRRPSSVSDFFTFSSQESEAVAVVHHHNKHHNHHQQAVASSASPLVVAQDESVVTYAPSVSGKQATSQAGVPSSTSHWHAHHPPEAPEEERGAVYILESGPAEGVPKSSLLHGIGSNWPSMPARQALGWKRPGPHENAAALQTAAPQHCRGRGSNASSASPWVADQKHEPRRRSHSGSAWDGGEQVQQQPQHHHNHHSQHRPQESTVMDMSSVSSMVSESHHSKESPPTLLDDRGLARQHSEASGRLSVAADQATQLARQLTQSASSGSQTDSSRSAVSGSVSSSSSSSASSSSRSGAGASHEHTRRTTQREVPRQQNTLVLSSVASSSSRSSSAEKAPGQHRAGFGPHGAPASPGRSGVEQESVRSFGPSSCLSSPTAGSFSADLVKGCMINVLKQNGELSNCFCTMTQKLDGFRIKLSKDSREFTDIPLASIVETVSGKNTAGTEMCSKLATPLDDHCVTWALKDGNCISFKFPSLQARDSFTSCMDAFIEDTSKRQNHSDGA